MTRIIPDGIGINRNGLHVRDGCVSSPTFANDECSDLVYHDNVRRYFSKHCEGKHSCMIPTSNDPGELKIFKEDNSTFA